MRFTHRLAGLASICSLVTALLVTSGFVCSVPGDASQMAQMPGMDMGGMSMPHAPAEEGAETPTSSCEFPWAPSGCVSMAPCAPTAVAAQSVGLTEVSSPALRVASASPLAPPSETIAPELPPPRA